VRFGSISGILLDRELFQPVGVGQGQDLVAGPATIASSRRSVVVTRIGAGTPSAKASPDCISRYTESNERRTWARVCTSGHFVHRCHPDVTGSRPLRHGGQHPVSGGRGRYHQGTRPDRFYRHRPPECIARRSCLSIWIHQSGAPCRMNADARRGAPRLASFRTRCPESRTSLIWQPRPVGRLVSRPRAPAPWRPPDRRGLGPPELHANIWHYLVEGE
jgi:hypothetical protein